MITKNTCSTCLNKEGNIDSKCEIRSQCPDDGSTTEKRKQIITTWPEVIEE